VKFKFIEDHQEDYSVEVMCDMLEVSRAGYYAWVDRPASARAGRHEELLEEIRRMKEESYGAYGTVRIHRAFRKRKMRVTRKTVAKLLRENGLNCVAKRGFVPQTTDSNHGHAVAGNLLNQDFSTKAINTTWVSDITYIPTDEGWLYLAAVMDLHSRKIIGWSVADHMRSELVCDALSRALKERNPAGSLIHHSDRGVQYACDDYQRMLSLHGLTCSMSRKGNCYDNAVMESFFGTLKTEWVHQRRYRTRAEAKQSLFEYIEAFYNRKRMHSSLGYVSPVEFESSLN
jgi:transposase InsO family protein